jgi:hypothetical protein
MLYVNAASLTPLQSLSLLKKLVSAAETEEDIAEVAALGNIEELELPYLNWAMPDQLTPLSGMASLWKLFIEGVSPTLDTQNLPSIPQAQSLQIAKAGDYSHDMTADFVTAFPELRELILGRLCADEEYCLFTDYSALGQLSHLQSITFHRPALVDLTFVSSLGELVKVSFLRGDDSQWDLGGLDFAPLVALLSGSTRTFTIEVANSALSSQACSEQIPALRAMPNVTVETSSVDCLSAEGEGEGEGEGETFHASVDSNGTGPWYIDYTTLELTVSVAGATCSSPDCPQYQWYKDGQEDGNKIDGATGAVLTLEYLTSANNGLYYCQVTDDSKGEIWTDPIPVIVVGAGALPVAGMLGLGLLAWAFAVGARFVIRKRK